ncbi:Mur ligase family protein [Streptomyces nigrescens]
MEALTPNGYALLNADGPYVMGMAERTKARTVLYGRSPGTSVRAKEVCLGEQGRPAFAPVTSSGRARVALDLIGEHQVANALGAAAATATLELSIEDRPTSKLQVIGAGVSR